MGERNMQYSSQMTDMETDRRALDYIHPEPCIYYGSVIPQPNVHPMIQAPGNASNLSARHPPEHHDTPLFFGMTQYTGFQPQHPAPNLDLAVAPPSNSYYPYMPPPTASRDFPVPVNHGASERMSFSSTHRAAATPMNIYGRGYYHMDDVRESFKRKTAEGIPGVFPYHNTLTASSSSVAPGGAWPVESDVSVMDAPSFAPPDFRRTETSSISEHESNRGGRSRSDIVGPGSEVAHNNSHQIQGSYANQPFQLPGNPWLDMQFSNNGGDSDTLVWSQAPTVPYIPGNVGGQVDTGIMGLRGYQITPSNRSSSGFLPTPFLHRHPNIHHPPPPPPPPPIQGGRGHMINFPLQGTSSRNASMNPFQGGLEGGPRYTGSVRPSGLRLHRPYQREFTYDMNARQRNHTHLRILPEEGVAMLEVPGYYELTDSADQHRDMRLDIDHMSYEELLALGEQIGSVTTGVTEEMVASHLKTRSFLSFANCSNQEGRASADQDSAFCVICQNDYKDQELVGTLDCGHEYHVDCVKRWLLVKNTCPICKSTALNTARREDE